MKQLKLSSLPDILKVQIVKTRLGKYVVQFPEYDVFTESDSLEELDYFINDMIFTLFDVPKEMQAKIVYRSKKEHPTDLTKVDLHTVNTHQLLATRDIANHLRA
ncbi:MAG: hypothetical protein AAB937_00735 [Patescibacteria group bacterium]